MTKWEYDITTLIGENTKGARETLDEYGKAGWELVCIIRSADNNYVMIAYFKREKE
jgi:hypothetical protein